MNTDEIFKLSEDWGNIKYGSKIIVMGTGRIGRRVLPVLFSEFEIPYLIDKNCRGEIISGINVLGIEEGVQKAKDQRYKIIVTTMRGVYEEISSILKKYGLSEDTDYCLFERFAQEWNLRWQNKCVFAKIDTVITSRCSLNCRNCNIFISHIRDPKDIEYKELIRNFDILFKLRNSRKYRIPDEIADPKAVLKKELPEMTQIDGAKRIAEHMNIMRNSSHSFRVFVEGVKRISGGNN